MKKIALGGKHGKGKFALVDDEDFEELNKYKWYYMAIGYAIRKSYHKKKQTTILMHRLINNTSDNMETDHVDGNRLNNQKKNLRDATHSQNKMNRPMVRTNKYGAKGVHIQKHISKKGIVSNCISARIIINGKTIYLGTFSSINLASIAYQEAEIKYFGEYSYNLSRGII